jgi:hypothetical protein
MPLLLPSNISTRVILADVLLLMLISNCIALEYCVTGVAALQAVINALIYTRVLIFIGQVSSVTHEWKIAESLCANVG